MFAKGRMLNISIAVILVAASLAGGAYVGYQGGYSDSSKEANIALQKQVENNTLLVEENEALSAALHDASNMGEVKIGYISSSATDFEASQPIIEEIIQPDLNEYARKLGYNVTFKIIMKDAEGQNKNHLQKMKELKSEGVDIVISGGWSSMMNDSLSYANENNMLIIGTASTDPALASPNDRLFRMQPPESCYASSVAGVMWNYGVKSVIVISSNSSMDIEFVDYFETYWAARGGELAGNPIIYPHDETHFSNYLKAANAQAQTAKEKYPDDGRVAILLLAFSEDEYFISRVDEYTPLYDCVMFCGYRRIGLMTDDFMNNENAIHLKSFHLYERPFESSLYDEFTARLGDGHSVVRDACLYDAAWVIVTSVLETRSTDASIVASVFPDVCCRHYGASGWCNLDENGDRMPLPYDVWFYTQGSTYNKSLQLAGVYTPDTDTVIWNSGELDYTPDGP